MAVNKGGQAGAPEGPNFSSLYSILLSALLSSSFPSREQPCSQHQTPGPDPHTAKLPADSPDNTSQSMWGPHVLGVFPLMGDSPTPSFNFPFQTPPSLQIHNAVCMYTVIDPSLYTAQWIYFPHS